MGRYGRKYRTWGDFNRAMAEKRRRAVENAADIREKYIVDDRGRIIAPRRDAPVEQHEDPCAVPDCSRPARYLVPPDEVHELAGKRLCVKHFYSR